jgi:hypothetical protein
LNYFAHKNSKIIIYDNEVNVTKRDIRRLKHILDKLSIHYIIDDVSFHATDAMANLMKQVKDTRIWKVEEDGSVNHKNRFGHSGHFEYRTLCIPSLIEFLFADMNLLNDKEVDFLDVLIKRASDISIGSLGRG